tara:strand:- start:30 stop:263 length:234 start_codon:yes stop_codon:yes gene_type:complete
MGYKPTYTYAEALLVHGIKAESELSLDELLHMNSIERFNLAEKITNNRFYSGHTIFKGTEGLNRMINIIKNTKGFKL